MSRAIGDPAVRRSASRLRQLLFAKQQGLLRGTLVELKRKCGKPTCHCREGEPHVCLCVSQSRNGKQRLLYIPKDMEQEVRRWVERYHEVRELLDQLSEHYREQLLLRKSKRRNRSRSGDSTTTS